MPAAPKTTQSHFAGTISGADLSDSLTETFRDATRDFLARSHSTQRVRTMRDAAPCYARSAWLEMANLGWMSVAISEADGGLGLGLRELCAIAEEAGAQLLPEPFLSAGVHAAMLLRESEAGDLRSTLLHELTAGRLVAAVAWQEQLGQLNAGLPATRAVHADGQARLSGTKLFVAAPADADGWIVSATAEGALGLYWVPKGMPGLQVTQGKSADGSTTVSLTLVDVCIPLAHCLAHAGAALRALEVANDLTRIVQASELLGVARRALTITLEYARVRVQFGRPIGSFQALQHRLVDAYIQTELCHACLASVLAAVEQTGAGLQALASRVKARASHAALVTTRLAIQVHGAMGFTDACDVGLYFKRALTLNAWLGNVPQHRNRHFHAARLLQATLGPVEPPMQADGANASESYAHPYPRLSDWNAIPETAFRQNVRAFFTARFPSRFRNSPHRLRWNEIKDWFMTLSRQGWIAPSWPKEFGGMGLPPDKLLAFIEEQEQYGVARAPDQGIIMLGPLLIQHGTAAQQREFLPRILAGEHVWCQGYSEPNAGSDLASLRTEAVLAGDHFVVTGQKIWSTLAHDATHMFMLVRTDKAVKPQAGISFLLVDLATPGITVRPILDITGHEEFCEVFFDGVQVPAANLVGQLNQGWTIAKALLGYERIYSGSPKQSQYAFAQLTALAKAQQLFEDPAFSMRYAELEMDLADLGAAYTHFAQIVKRGDPLPPNISYLKIVATETYQRIAMLLVEAAAENGATVGDCDFGNGGAEAASINVLAPLYNATPATIYGGSNEIQRNILAKTVLHLPS